MRAAHDKSSCGLRAVVAGIVAALALASWLGASASHVRAQTRRATVADYRGRVERAARTLDALAEETRAGGAGVEAWARGDGRESPPDAGASAVREVRALVPPAESVERREGGVLEVDNRWLHAELTRHEHLRDADDARARSSKTELLKSAAERLRALGERLAELEGTAAGDARRDKEAEKGRLAEILRGPDFAERGARGGALRRILESISKWVRDLLPDWQPIQPGTSPAASKAAQVVVYALAGGLLVFALWRFWRRRAGRAPRSVYRREPRVVLGERLAPDESAADLLAEAERLARAGDTRAAIRKAYVALLCELGERRVVRLSRHKTNRDYLQAVRERAAPHLFQLFQPLTLAFERHWYGAVDATPEDWDDFRANCRRAIEARPS